MRHVIVGPVALRQCQACLLLAQKATTELQQSAAEAQQAVLLWWACTELLLVLRMLNFCGLRKNGQTPVDSGSWQRENYYTCFFINNSRISKKRTVVQARGSV
jgi:hypothetical protein